MSKAKLLAYQTIIKKGGRADKVRKAIINFMTNNEENSATIHEMIDHLGIPHQTLTGQLSAMADLGLVRENGNKTIDQIVYTVYTLTTAEEMQLAMNIRKYEKYQRWIKSGMNNFPDYMPKRILNLLKNEYDLN